MKTRTGKGNDMEAIKTKDTNCVYAEDQDEYLSLPVHKSNDGIVTSCWKLSLRERVKILLFGKLYLQMLTFNNPLQPVRLDVCNPVDAPDKGGEE